MSITIDCHGETHVGQHRPDNEDQFLIADLNKSMRVHQTSLGLSHQTRLFGGSQGKLFLVADGLGGHESGERASTLAVDLQQGKADTSPQDTKEYNPMGHALWNVIGGPDKSLDPQVSQADLAVGDSLLLCSDGLTRYFPDEELLSEISQEVPAITTCQHLVGTANERGGKDNITAVLARFVESNSKSLDFAAIEKPATTSAAETVTLETQSNHTDVNTAI